MMRDTMMIAAEKIAEVKKIKADFDFQLEIEENPLSLAKLALFYFDDLPVLSAFLWWFLDSRVSAKEIIESGILHLFYIHHQPIGDDESDSNNIFNELLTLLSETQNSLDENENNIDGDQTDDTFFLEEPLVMSDNHSEIPSTLDLNDFPIETLLDLVSLARKTYCGVRGTMIDKPVGERFISVNLFNEEFEHNFPFKIEELRKNAFEMEIKIESHYVIPALPPFYFSLDFDHIHNLYGLFKFNFIKLLDATDPDHNTAFSYLKERNSAEMLSALTQNIIQQNLNVVELDAFVKMTASLFSIMQSKEFFQLISKNYFFICFAAFNDRLLNMLNMTKIKLELNPVFSNHFANPPIVMLTSLFIELEKKTERYSPEFIVSMQKNIFECALRLESISDSVLYELKKLSNIQTFCVDKINEYEKELRKCFDENFSYEKLELEWKSFFYKMNTIKELFRDVSTKTHYPFNSNELKAYFIDYTWKTCPKFNFSQVRGKIFAGMRFSETEKKKEFKRVLLETLVFTDDEKLLPLIVSYLPVHYPDCQNNGWVELIFGDGKALLEKAIIKKNVTLVDLIIAVIQFQKLQMKKYFSLSADVDFFHFIEKCWPDNKNIELLFYPAKAAAKMRKMPLFESIIELVIGCKPNQIAIDFGFAAFSGNWTSVYQMLHAHPKLVLNPALASFVLGEAVESSRWIVVGDLFVGFTHDIAVLQRAAKKLLKVMFPIDDVCKKLFFALDTAHGVSSRQNAASNNFRLLGSASRLSRPPYDFYQVAVALKLIEQFAPGWIEKLRPLTIQIFGIIEDNERPAAKMLIEAIRGFKNSLYATALKDCLTILLRQIENRKIDFDLLRQSQSANSAKRERRNSEDSDEDEAPRFHGLGRVI
ncbi:MAG: hypothetical protein NTZ67_03690 [Gammaproteobacteria bacterium]|nr:hypothetical protein [Gammaproteobacteria bacterium]